ncbi:MAG: hypothetical protein QOJ39_367 [Candidatus Eremiobacteraeota bacterium]|jgi:hypothetical protein|nr:hypothetical protein [Candidatus Eremiobacteraeota bacterium]MEA2718503.1 hypothetical protein [Candidatus Eremiobacteraeota bacterium]
MNFTQNVDQTEFAGLMPVAESDQFAIYAVGGDTYVLVQRHNGVPWSALRLSGDGVFRVGSLLIDAMRHLYRDVASNLSPNALEANAKRRP